MLILFTGYKRFPYKVLFRQKMMNVIRYVFKIPTLENLLVAKCLLGITIWKKFIPPNYFYAPGSNRVVERNGLKYSLDISMFLDHAIFFNQVNEDEAQKNLFKLISPDSIVCDVGANIGFLTLNFASICPKGLIFALEPDLQNFKALQINVASNDFKNIKIFKKGVGANLGNEILYKYFPANPGTNRILKIPPKVNHQSESIEIITLDSFFQLHSVSKLDLIKIDVEGFERFVLEGARNTIDKFRPILFVELVEVNFNQQGYTAISLIEYIESLGYDVKDATTMTSIDRTIPLHNTDVICFHKANSISGKHEEERVSCGES